MEDEEEKEEKMQREEAMGMKANWLISLSIKSIIGVIHKAKVKFREEGEGRANKGRKVGLRDKGTKENV